MRTSTLLAGTLLLVCGALFSAIPCRAAGEESGPQTMGLSIHVQGRRALPLLDPYRVGKRYRMSLDTEPSPPAAGAPTRLTVQITDQDGREVTTMVPTGDRKIHFFLIGARMEDFNHLRPEDYGPLTPETDREGRFIIPVSFSHGGLYKLIAEFADHGYYVVKTFSLGVEGPGQEATRLDYSRSRIVDGLKVSLSARPFAPRSGDTTNFVVRVASASAEPITDPSPYLGALAHVFVFRDGADYLGQYHSEPVPGPAGPEMPFWVDFREKGFHRMFVQFKRGETIVTVPFDVDVERGEPLF